MAISVFNGGATGGKLLYSKAYTYYAKRENDVMGEQSWKATEKCMVIVSVACIAARGGQYIRLNGSNVSYNAEGYANYGAGYLFAFFNANKGDIITFRPSPGDTNKPMSTMIVAFS